MVVYSVNSDGVYNTKFLLLDCNNCEIDFSLWCCMGMKQWLVYLEQTKLISLQLYLLQDLQNC